MSSSRRLAPPAPHGYAVDTASLNGECRRRAQRAITECGRIDVLVNNATGPGRGARLEDADLDRVRRTLDVNIVGTVAMTQAVIPEAGRGSITRAGDATILLNPGSRS